MTTATTTPTLSDVDPLDAARTRAAALLAKHDQLPDPSRATSPYALEQHERTASILRGRFRTLMNAVDAVVDLDARIEPDRPWCAVLLDARAHFAPLAATLAGKPRGVFVEPDAEEALRCVDYGPRDMWSLPSMLADFLRARGFLALPGQSHVFAGRGGLLAVEERLAAAEAARTSALDVIRAELAQPLDEAESV
jgi:hypothetical protein